MFKPELLAPAGSLDKLKTAIGYGADAVYLAGQKYSLRSAAENFNLEQLSDAVTLAHNNGTKVYVVLNSFPHDHDLQDLDQFVSNIAELIVDGVIASDLGVIQIVRANSNLPIHLSTQASCLNLESAFFWKNQGVTRLILGREASISDAGAIKRATGLEVELFIHGSMCMAYSGNCTISNFTKGRDSNRGGCSQSCRFSYSLENQPRTACETNAFFMSSKDLLGIELLPHFFNEKIDSIKIEGRMRSPLYAGLTSKVYRQALDHYHEHHTLLPEQLSEWINQLNSVPHRDYMTGNLLAPVSQNSTLLREPNPAESGDRGQFVGLIRKIDKSKNYMLVDVRCAIERGQTIELIPFKAPAQTLKIDFLQNALGQDIQRAEVNTMARLSLNSLAEVNCLVRKESRP